MTRDARWICVSTRVWRGCKIGCDRRESSQERSSALAVNAAPDVTSDATSRQIRLFGIRLVGTLIFFHHFEQWNHNRRIGKTKDLVLNLGNTG